MKIVFLFCLSFVSIFLLTSLKAPKESSITLGKKLFFDNILSSNKKISCASCHIPQFAFADTAAFSNGVNGKTGRNTPSVNNMSARPYLFWDGRAADLEAQVWFPIEDHNEMNLPRAEAVSRILNDKLYVSLFKKVYRKLPNENNIADALASYERSLETSGSSFDKYIRGDETAINETISKGRTLFIGKAKCFDCHFSPDFTGDEFKNIGIYNAKEYNDKGRYNVTKKESDIGLFKVPGLRNIAKTSPYMHNGMFKTLVEVVAYYNNPDVVIANSIGRDTLLNKPLNLTEQEQKELVAFLNALTDK